MEIRIQGLKSYNPNQMTSISLLDGNNIIIGPNGAGKSTLLEVIQFGLIGRRPSKISNIS